MVDSIEQLWSIECIYFFFTLVMYHRIVFCTNEEEKEMKSFFTLLFMLAKHTLNSTNIRSGEWMKNRKERPPWNQRSKITTHQTETLKQRMQDCPNKPKPYIRAAKSCITAVLRSNIASMELRKDSATDMQYPEWENHFKHIQVWFLDWESLWFSFS